VKTPYAVVDRDRCFGTGLCVQTAPGAFAADAAGLSQYRDGDWDAADLQDAADSCPMSAIRVVTGDAR
jgi:ferredoxin